MRRSVPVDNPLWKNLYASLQKSDQMHNRLGNPTRFRPVMDDIEATEESERQPLRVRAYHCPGTWDVMAPWLSRLLSTGGSWVRLPL